MPPELVCSANHPTGHTAAMAKKKATSHRKPQVRSRRAARRQAQVHEPRSMAEVISAEPPDQQRLLMRLSESDLAEAMDPLRAVDPLEKLAEALEMVGIDPAKPSQPDEFLGDAWHKFVQVRSYHADLVALAVAHAQDARAVASWKPGKQPGTSLRDAQQQAFVTSQQMTKHLRDLVQATLYLQRNMRPPAGIQDDRRPLMMDGEIIALVAPEDDARSALVTLKLPRVVIDRLRDAVLAMAPSRTMAGIAALGITMVLDLLEAEHLRHTGQGFPRRPGEVLEGGRPSRTTATTAQPAPLRKHPQKQGKRPQ